MLDKADERGVTGLMCACMNNNYNEVKELLEKGSSINLQDNQGWTALIYAINFGYYDIAKLLCDYGADCARINKYGQNIAHCIKYSLDKNNEGFLKKLKMIFNYLDTDSKLSILWNMLYKYPEKIVLQMMIDIQKNDFEILYNKFFKDNFDDQSWQFIGMLFALNSKKQLNKLEAVFERIAKTLDLPAPQSP